jgi:integrase
VELWEATKTTDPQLHAAIKIAAYSGARIEGVAQLKLSDIRFDPETRIRFMHMADKSTAGDRDVPIHPDINTLIDDLIKRADPDGYLIHSDAKNKYGERSQPLGKRFGRLKTALGYDGRYVFHSLRKTVTSLMQNARVLENVAADIVGHVKPGMTFGLYGGTTAMSLRANELFRSVRYPSWTVEENGGKE